MSCKCAIPTDKYHGWECTVTGGACEFLTPDSKSCAETFGEGPETEDSKCKECKYRHRRIDKEPCCSCENDEHFEEVKES